MEDNRDNIMIIFAGYPKEMDELMRINPGLESRIKTKLYLMIIRSQNYV